MSDDLRARADARLESALADSPFRDPRPDLRPMLKHLREHDAPAFDRALAHFETTLIPAVAGEADPLEEWLAYGRVLATLAGGGEILAIDGSGRAGPVGEATPAPDAMLLHLPASPDTPALVLRCPRDATPAQEASVDLLVLGRVTVRDQPSGAGR